MKRALPPEIALRLAALSPAQRELLQRRLQQQGFDVPLVTDLDAETVLPEDLRPRWSGTPSPAPSRVLVTGATGYLGAHLVAEW